MTEGIRQLDIAEYLMLTRTHRLHQTYSIVINGRKALQQAYGYREENHKHYQYDFRQHFVAQPDHKQRSYGNSRDRLTYYYKWIDHLVYYTELIHYHSSQKTNKYAEKQTYKGFRKRDPGMT